jgi:hypothetical protein
LLRFSSSFDEIHAYPNCQEEQQQSFFYCCSFDEIKSIKDKCAMSTINLTRLAILNKGGTKRFVDDYVCLKKF